MNDKYSNKISGCIQAQYLNPSLNFQCSARLQNLRCGSESRDSSVDIAMVYGWMAGLRVRAGARFFSPP
jgi:hypothetical protein